MPHFSLLMPTFGHSAIIEETLNTIKSQDFQDYEVIIIPDGEAELYADIQKRWVVDKRYKFFMQYDNVGYCGNLKRCLAHAMGKFVIYFASDDLMGPGMLSYYNEVYKKYNVSAILRTYYWYEHDYQTAVRAKRVLEADTVILDITSSDPREIQIAFETVDQLTGLSFQRTSLTVLNNQHVFPCHAYPLFDSILMSGKFAYVSKDFVAVRIGASQCITISKIYRDSPIMTWTLALEKFNAPNNYGDLKSYLKKNWIGSNFLGFLQIRTFSERPLPYLVREIYYLLKLNPLAVFNPVFLGVVGLCFIFPSMVLLKITTFVKNKMLRYVQPNLSSRKIGDLI